ncbi:hypothetical protein D3C80_2093620 [compost metagenome]
MTVPGLSLRHSLEQMRPITRALKPSMMPVTMLQVSTMKTAHSMPASASTESLKSSLVTLPSISRPTYIRAGAVA